MHPNSGPCFTRVKIEFTHRARHRFFGEKLAHSSRNSPGLGGVSHDIVPDYVLEDLANAESVDGELRGSAKECVVLALSIANCKCQLNRMRASTREHLVLPERGSRR